MFQKNRICPSYFKKKHLSAPSNSKGHPHMRPSKRNNYLIQVLLKDNPICYRPFRVHPNLLKTLQSTPQSAPSPSKGHPNYFRSFKRTPHLLQALQMDTPICSRSFKRTPQCFRPLKWIPQFSRLTGPIRSRCTSMKINNDF